MLNPKPCVGMHEQHPCPRGARSDRKTDSGDKRSPGLPVIPESLGLPSLLTDSCRQLQAPRPGSRAAHGSRGVQRTPEPTPAPTRAAPARVPRADLDSLAAPPLALSALAQGAGACPRRSLPPNPGGASGRSLRPHPNPPAARAPLRRGAPAAATAVP